MPANCCRWAKKRRCKKAWIPCAGEIGQPDLEYVKARWVNWPEDEFALGGYSACLPGHYDARDNLAQPTPPLYWAGEASAPHHLTAMVHGAYFTGQRAANEIIRAGSAS